MMLVSHKHKWVFVHIPKAAGSSMNAFLRALDPDCESLCTRTHEPVSHIRERHPNEFENYFKFAVVRNPWARAVSLFHYRQMSRDNNPPHWPSREEIDSLSFREVVLRSLEQNPAYQEVCPPRDAPEIAWLEPSCFSWINIDNKIAVDYVCKMENIESDIQTICQHLELSAPTFPHTNMSDHRHYTEYYDRETIEIVSNRYAKDIQYFGYEFGC